MMQSKVDSNSLPSVVGTDRLLTGNEKYKDNTKLMCDEYEEIEYTNDEFS